MTRFGWLVLCIVLVVIAGMIAAWFYISNHLAQPVSPTVATSTPQANLEARSIYTNGEFGFSIVYPGVDVIDETFSPWRAAAIATGTPLLAIADPSGTVRIGASSDAKEVKACKSAGPSEKAIADMTLGSTTFKAFIHDQLGTENQTRTTSYRTIHESSCIALETVRPLVNGAVATGTSLDEIVSSFSFARP